MQIIRKAHTDNDTNLLEHITFRYVPYWPLFLILFVLFFGAAWVYVKYQTPVYEIGAKVLFKDEKKGAEGSKALEDLNIISPKKIVENEIEVLKSKPVINRVVTTLNLYAPISENSKFGKKSAYSSSPVSVQLQNPDSLRPVEKVNFEYNYKTATVVMDGVSYSIDKWYATSYGNLQFVKSPAYKGADDVTKFYFSLVPIKNVANSISGRLDVTTPNKLASIVELKLKDEVPERGENILNAVIDSYNAALNTEKTELADNTLKFIDDRLAKVKNDLDSIERKKKEFRTATGSIDIGAQGQMLLDNVSYADKKLSEVNMQLSMLNQVELYVQTKDPSGRLVPSTMGINDPVMSSLVNNLYQTEMDYNKAKNVDGENNPSTLALANQLEKMRPSILENIQSQKRSLQASRASVSATNGQFNSMLRAIPDAQRRLIQIEREQKIESGIYEILLQKREDAALSQVSTTESNSRVVDRAEASEAPVSPKKKLIYLSALLIALFSGIGIVFVKEKAGNKIMFRHDIEDLTELPIIGEIAAEATRNPIVIDDRRKTVIAEQFRKLRVSLNYIGVNSKRKRILVTSSISGEGKSFIATNLAISLAITGKKVVLLDFDLNNPSLNNKLNIKGQKGITDYLLDGMEVDDIIMQTDLHPNLSLISTGKLPFNPSELIMSSNVEKLFDYLDTKFDYIVIDTAPVVPVTDAYLLSKYCDATLFIVRHNYSPKILVEMFDENNKLNKLKNAAIVFNGVKPRGFGKQSYSYGYGYTSGYAYQNGYIQSQTPKSIKE